MELRLFYVPLQNKRYGDEWNLKDSTIAKNKEPQGHISYEFGKENISCPLDGHSQLVVLIGSSFTIYNYKNQMLRGRQQRH